jgi:hypothetical protein
MNVSVANFVAVDVDETAESDGTGVEEEIGEVDAAPGLDDRVSDDGG